MRQSPSPQGTSASLEVQKLGKSGIYKVLVYASQLTPSQEHCKLILAADNYTDTKLFAKYVGTLWSSIPDSATMS